MNIDNITQRQFDFSFRREKITITDYYDPSIQYDVFFRRDNRGTSPQGKLRLFYADDTPICIGTIFILGNANYLVISKEAVEGVVYRSSIAVKCTESINVKDIDGVFVEVPIVLNTGRYISTDNGTISIIDGSITIYTALTDVVKTMDGDYRIFGGTYSVQNHLYDDGIAYIYMDREADSKYELTYDGLTTLSLTTGTYQLTYTAKKNDIVVENPDLIYQSSNPEIATVSDTGLLTLLSDGTTRITATWIEAGTTCRTDITIDLPVTLGYSSIDGGDFVRFEREYDFDGHFYTSDGIEVSEKIGQWTIECDFVEQINYTIDGNTITFAIDDYTIVGKTFMLKFSDPDGQYTESSQEVLIRPAPF